ASLADIPEALLIEFCPGSASRPKMFDAAIVIASHRDGLRTEFFDELTVLAQKPLERATARRWGLGRSSDQHGFGGHRAQDAARLLELFELRGRDGSFCSHIFS